MTQMSAYLLYQNAMREQFKRENPGMVSGTLVAAHRVADLGGVETQRCALCSALRLLGNLPSTLVTCTRT